MCIDTTTKKFEGVMLFFEKYRNEGFGLDFLFKFWFVLLLLGFRGFVFVIWFLSLFRYSVFEFFFHYFCS